MCSHSFGRYIDDEVELEQLVAAYISRAAEKVRAQRSMAGALTVFIRTNPFQQRQGTRTILLPELTADTRVLVRWPQKLLRGLFRPGYQYQEAGVMLSELVPQSRYQRGLFDAEPAARHRAAELMATMDRINQR